MATREEKIEVKVTGADKGAADLEKMGGTAKVAGESVKGLGKEADKAAKGVDELGDEAKQTGGQLDTLERQIVKAKLALKALGDQYARVGDEKIGVQLDKQSSALAKLEGRARTIARLAKDLEPKGGGGGGSGLSLGDVMGGPARKRSLFGRLLGGLGSAASSAGGAVSSGANALADQLTNISPMTLAKVGLGIAAAPAVAGAAGGAALAGGALAGVGLGIGGAIANNPKPFRDAWDDAISEISQRWQRASLGFEKPSLEAFGILKKAVGDIDLEGMLKSAQQYVTPLAVGVAGFVTPLANGIKILVDKAGPVVAVLENSLPKLGKAFEQAFSDIGDGSDGAANALEDIIGLVGTAVIAVGKFVEVGSKIYDWGQKNLSILGGTETHITSVGRALGPTTDATHKYVLTQQDLADAARKAADELDDETDVILRLGQAQDDSTRATEAFKKSLKEHGKVLEGNSEAAMANRDALRDAIGAYVDEHEAALAAAKGDKAAIDDANGAFINHLQTLREIERQAGLNTAAIDAMIEEAKKKAGLIATYVIKVRYDVPSRPPGLPANLGTRYGGTDMYASGGDVRRTGLALVGEEGPELVALSRGDHVFNAADTARMKAVGSAGSGVVSGGRGGGGAAALPPDSVLRQALAAIVVQLMQEGRLPVPSSAVH